MKKLLFKIGLIIFMLFLISPDFVICQSQDNKANYNGQPADSVYLNFTGYRVQYPAIAKENRIEGKVVIWFDIDSNCSLVNRRIMQAIGGGCEEEVMKTLDAAEADLKERKRNRCKPSLDRVHEVIFRLN